MMGLLPFASTPMERAADLLAAMRIDAVESPLRALWSAENCPEDLLPWLAWALSIDSWDADWPLHIRRARVASAIAIQRIKGTAQSVEDVVRSFGGNIVLREWFQESPPADPYTFKLTVTLGTVGAEAPSSAFIDAVISEVARTKPARSHFTFVVGVNATARIGLRAVARPAVFARITAPAT